MDRLIAAAAWNEPQSLELALLVAEHQEDKIDWKQIDEFVIREGIKDDKETREFYRSVDRQFPD